MSKNLRLARSFVAFARRGNDSQLNFARASVLYEELAATSRAPDSAYYMASAAFCYSSLTRLVSSNEAEVYLARASILYARSGFIYSKFAHIRSNLVGAAAGSDTYEIAGNIFYLSALEGQFISSDLAIRSFSHSAASYLRAAYFAHHVDPLVSEDLISIAKSPLSRLDLCDFATSRRGAYLNRFEELFASEGFFGIMKLAEELSFPVD